MIKTSDVISDLMLSSFALFGTVFLTGVIFMAGIAGINLSGNYTGEMALFYLGAGTFICFGILRNNDLAVFFFKDVIKHTRRLNKK